ncbi:SHOCT domain-containing protein [uncultured Pontibacter sp.]|uniref:SHOCT domain-containing protein n=1 Tax=uncultured Pontibacter sp. TaxID=453356 RepID=UPI00260DFF4A|nr:SHOCT domain-containing protein [uncultured Pontibacter sp.]
MKKLFTPFYTSLLAIILLAPLSASAQRLSRLMQERAKLYEDWEYYNGQNNAFFGGKSNKDLSNIIQVQKSIIDKDNEIMEEVRTLNVNTQKGLRAELEASQDQIASYKTKVGNLETQLATTTELYNDSLSETASQSSYNNISFIIILALLSTTAFMAFKLRKLAGRQEELSDLSISSRITYDADDYIAKLEKIGKLKDNGLITEEDYKVQKDKILAAL